MKKCSKCNCILILNKTWLKYHMNEHRNLCKSCNSIRSKKYRNPNYNKEYWFKNKDRLSKQKKIYDINHRKERQEYNKEYYLTHRDEILRQKKEQWDDVYSIKKEYYIEKADKRKRNLNWNKLFDNPFDSSEKINWHHINDDYILALPEDIHLLFYGKNHKENLEHIIMQIYPLED